MNFSYNEDQAALMAGLDQLIAAEAPPAPTEPVFQAYAEDLDAALATSGFLDIAREDGFGLLDGALVAQRLARLPQALEVASTAIIAPALNLDAGLRPLALMKRGQTTARYLDRAQAVVIDAGDQALLLTLDPGEATPVSTLFAYPYGRIDAAILERANPVSDGRTLRRAARIALASEAAGCMAAALDVVLEHVRDRRAFNRPLGAFQAVQHRLAMAAETAESTRWLALRAAWSGAEEDAAVAAGFAQMRIASFTYDLHQFTGAMGLTLEFPLHFWTYRLRALAGELGGSSAQARSAAGKTWGDTATGDAA